MRNVIQKVEIKVKWQRSNDSYILGISTKIGQLNNNQTLVLTLRRLVLVTPHDLKIGVKLDHNC